jgi:hypothetical protein
MEEMWWWKDKCESNMTPRFLACDEGVIWCPAKVKGVEGIFEHCCGVPTRRNSVLEGLRERWLADSQCVGKV